MAEAFVRRWLRRLFSFGWRLARGLVHTAYLIVFRSALYVLALYLVVYFFVNSTHFRGVFEPSISVVLDGGHLEADHWRWGPLPWQGGAIDARCRTPRGDTVIEAAWADGEVDLSDLLRWVFDAVVVGKEEPFRLHVTRGEAHGFIARLDFDETNHLALVDAFDAPDEIEGPGSGMEFRIRISNAKASDGRALLRFPNWSLDVDVEDAEAEIVVADTTRVGSRLVSIRRGQGVIDLGADPETGRPRRLQPRLGRTHVQGFRWLGDGLDLVRVRTVIDDAMHVDATGAMSFAGAVPTFRGTAQVDVERVPDAARALFGELLSGSFSVVARGEGAFDDIRADAVVRSPAATLAGVDFDDVGVSIDLRRESLLPGERPYVLRLPTVAFAADGGRIRVDDFVWRPEWVSDPVQGPAGILPVSDLLTARVWLEDADVGAWLARLGVAGAPAPAHGLASGHVELRAGRFAHADGAGWEAEAELATTVVWSGEGRWPVAPRYDIDGGVQFLERPPAAGDDAGLQGGLVVTGRDLRLRSGKDELRLDGGLSVSSGALDFSASGAVGHVAGLAAAFGLPNVDGRLRLQEARVRGSVAAPTGEGRVQLESLVVDGARVGDVSASLALVDGSLRVRRLVAEGPWGHIDGAATLQVLPGSVRARAAKERPPDPSGRARQRANGADSDARGTPVGRYGVDDLHAEGILLDQVLPGRGLAGTANLTIGRLTGDLQAPLRSLRGGGRLVVRDLRAAGERFRRAEATLEANDRTVALRDIRGVLAGGGRLRGDLSWEKRTGHVMAELHVPPLPLTAFALLGVDDWPAESDLGLDLRVEGDLTDPAIEGRVRFRGARARLSRRDGGQWLRIGDAEVQLHREPGGDLRLTSASFFPGFQLLDGSRVAFRGVSPRDALVRIGAVDWDPARLLPWMAAVDAEAAISAETEIRADLRTGDWGIALDAPVGGLRFRLQKGRVEFVNPEPLNARVGPGGVVLPGFVLAGSEGSRLVVCGSVAGDGAIDFAVSGDVTAEPVRVLLRRTFSRLEGRLRLTGDDDRRPAACGSDVLWEGGGALLVSGDVRTPQLLGRVELLGLHAQPRGFGREITLSRSAVLHVSPGRPGMTRISMPRHEAVSGAVEDGTFALWGWAELRDFLPSNGKLEFEGTDLYYSAPKNFNATFNPRLTFTFENMDDPERRTSALTGDVDITEGAYYRSFDTLARAFGGALSREQATPTQSLARAVPALADTALDIRVTGQNVIVTSGFTFGTTDLELRIDVKVRGTLARPLLWDRIEIVPGGLITYKIVRREFEVVRGVLDFRGDPEAPRLDVEARTEIEYYDDRSGSLSTLDSAPLDDERVVTITVKVEGTYPEIDVDLLSDERGWDPSDLQSFILTGAPATSTRGARAARSINLFTEDLANLAHKLLLSAFVDAITLGVTPEGGIDWGVIASLGRNLKLRTRVIQQGADKQYRARFEFRITERLSLEGQLKVNEENAETVKTYESKLRYRIPLD